MSPNGCGLSLSLSLSLYGCHVNVSEALGGQSRSTEDLHFGLGSSKLSPSLGTLPTCIYLQGTLGT